MKGFPKPFVILILLEVITGCFSGHFKVYPSFPKRWELVNKINDSTVSIDLRSKMTYGEFCNIIADKIISGNKFVKRTHFINLLFVSNSKNTFLLKTYFPSPDIRDSSYFFLATPGAGGGIFGGNKYLLQLIF